MQKEGDSLLILSLIFDGKGNVSVSLTIQDGTSEIYTADKLTKTVS